MPENNQPQPAPQGEKKTSYWVLILGVLIGGALITYFVSKSMTPEELPQFKETQKVYSDGEVVFYEGVLKSVEKIAEAKEYLFQGNNLYKNPNYQPAESGSGASGLPQAETAPSDKNGYLKASEKYALALEYFKTARQLLDQSMVSGLGPIHESCSGQIKMVIDNYISSTSLFFDDANNMYSGEKIEDDNQVITQARAKYLSAEDNMRDTLKGNCGNNLFIFWNESENGQQERAAAIIKKMYGQQPEVLKELLGLLSQPKPEGPQK